MKIRDTGYHAQYPNHNINYGHPKKGILRRFWDWLIRYVADL